MTQNKAGSPELHQPKPTPQPRSAHPGIKLSNRTFRQSWMGTCSISSYVIHFLILAFLTALPSSTRLKFSAAMMALATIGIFATDYLEDKLGAPSNNAQKST